VTAVLPSDAFEANPQVLFRELSGEAVLLNLESGVYFGLDPVGTRVWMLVTRQQPLAAVCATLLDEYDVSAEVIATDVLTLVADLCDKGLLQRRSAV
jgi:hypothetical protein